MKSNCLTFFLSDVCQLPGVFKIVWVCTSNEIILPFVGSVSPTALLAKSRGHCPGQQLVALPEEQE